MRQYKKTTLKNGLRVVTVASKETEAAAVLVLVKTGSKYETKGISGISHFLEHMLFKGTAKRPSTLKLIEPLDKVGGEYNAFTGQEYTGYWAKLNAAHLDLALDWVADIYLNSKIEEKEIEREKGTILQELNMILDTPARYVADLWDGLLYGDQPAGWDIIGRPETIKSLEREQFKRYLSEHYSAQNTIVAVAGKIKPEAVVQKIRKYFGDINIEPAKGKFPTHEKQTKPQSLVHFKKTDQTHLLLGVRGYNIFHPDRYALGVLATILGGYMSSRMFISIRERQGLAYYVSTAADMDSDTGCLMTRAGVDNNKASKAITSILKEYRKIRDKKVGPIELKKAKENIKGTTLLDMESCDEQASFYAFQELMTGEVLSLEEKFARIDKVSAEDIQRIARDIFRPEKLNLALIGPFEDKKKFDKLLVL